ncbi:hypothetical protein BGZ70_007382 [Mortierella alpina]|uniref:Uncharacterized protein n=1 Tax=Mortierella alpina TaxID=64518 RepID=A0A9P6J8A5_MORAP|nr:hypothetical protein BGZ70_007382 [Mortierella alpina]
MELPIRTIFEYPEMCHTIAGFLGYHDYSVLARVNKAFYRAFFPYLMRSVVIANTFKYFIHVESFYSVFTNRQKLPPPKILFKYGQHVYHLNLHFKETIDFCYFVKEDSDSNNYRLSTLSTFPGQIQTDLYLSLLEKCPNLGCLQISVTHSDRLPNDMPNDSGLEDAVVLEQANKKAEIIDDAIARMIRATATPLAVAEQLSEMNGCVFNAQDQESVSGSSHGLRKFFISNSNRFAKQSIEALIQRHSQSLRVLEIRNCARVGSAEMLQLLRLLPKLREAEFFFEEKIRYRHGLKETVEDVGQLEQAMVDDHEEEVTSSQESGKKSSEGDQGRPRLGPLVGPCMFSCTDSLTYLRVPVMSVTVWETLQHPWAKDVYGWFFSAIGTLTRLQELHVQSIEPKAHEEVAVVPFQLTVESGLWRWKGLGEMEVFSFEMVEHHNVGPPEIEWMRMHWPRLRELVGLDSAHQHPKNIECELLMRAAVPEIKVPEPNARTRLHLSERHYRSLETQK